MLHDSCFFEEFIFDWHQWKRFLSREFKIAYNNHKSPIILKNKNFYAKIEYSFRDVYDFWCFKISELLFSWQKCFYFILPWVKHTENSFNMIFKTLSANNTRSRQLLWKIRQTRQNLHENNLNNILRGEKFLNRGVKMASSKQAPTLSDRLWKECWKSDSNLSRSVLHFQLKANSTSTSPVKFLFMKTRVNVKMKYSWLHMNSKSGVRQKKRSSFYLKLCYYSCQTKKWKCCQTNTWILL